MFIRILKWVVGGLVAIVVAFALVLGVVLLFRTEPLAIIPGGPFFMTESFMCPLGSAVKAVGLNFCFRIPTCDSGWEINSIRCVPHGK
jgi:uncharacterized membrane protein YccF (DUF307 family)